MIYQVFQSWDLHETSFFLLVTKNSRKMLQFQQSPHKTRSTQSMSENKILLVCFDPSDGQDPGVKKWKMQFYNALWR